jgi:hypothetical protein
MASLENILNNFYFEEVDKPGSKYPKFGKAGRKDYIFTCKRCGSQSEPVKFDLDIKYRLGSHLVKNCNPVSSVSEQQQEEEQQQGPAE